jgi:lipoprotein-releasing system permease protein
LNFPLYIARRYAVSRKSKNVVNIISNIAMVGVVVGTMALVVVMSIFNGFDVLIKSFFSVFDQPIKITAVTGKTFEPNGDAFDWLKNHEAVAFYSETVEEVALLRYEERQYIAQMKGVDSAFVRMSQLDNYMYDGNFVLDDGNFLYTILGNQLAWNLGAGVTFVNPIFISVPRKGRTVSLQNPFNQQHLFLSGVYSVGQVEVDDKYAIIPIEVARDLLELDNEVTAIEIALKPGASVKRIQREIKKKLGENYLVQNRYEQHESYYRVMNSERFFIFLTLAFIVVVASFNLAGAITMLLLDKKKDINTLNSMGLTRREIGTIFLLNGLMVSAIGAVIGIVLGVLICLGQQHFGWISFPGNFVIESYPVDIRVWNLGVIAVTVLLIGGVASWLPVRLLPKHFFNQNN